MQVKMSHNAETPYFVMNLRKQHDQSIRRVLIQICPSISVIAMYGNIHISLHLQDHRLATHYDTALGRTTQGPVLTGVEVISSPP